MTLQVLGNTRAYSGVHKNATIGSLKKKNQKKIKKRDLWTPL